MSKSLKETLGIIHIKLAEALLMRIEDGTATAADLQVARGLLRDNNIQSMPEANPGMLRLVEALPFDDTEAAVG